MANSDYQQTGMGSFCTFIKLAAPVSREDAVFTFPQPVDGITPGVAGMIDDEIVHVLAVAPGSITVKRGCADTIPALHAAGATCWMFSEATGTDAREYAAGMDIGVKVSPFTTGGGTLAVRKIVPVEVIFNWRFFRPYPPAQMKVNNARWHVGAEISEAQPNMLLSWVHRDRVLQANILVGHDDPSIGPEPGVSYTMRVYTNAGALLRTEVGLSDQDFNYQWPQIVHDFGYPNEPRGGYIEFTSTRDLLEGWQSYRCPFTVDPMGVLTSQFMSFASVPFEVPYLMNLRNGLIGDANYLMGVAARPLDRMSDTFDLVGLSDVQSYSGSAYTPWVTSEYRLPELERTLTIRESSFADGVPVEFSNIGRLAMIDKEFVQIDAIGTDGTITLRRGCLDTVPAVHLPGARLWFVEAEAGADRTEYAGDEQFTVKFVPKVYGPDVLLSDVPAASMQIVQRSIRPYPPARIVINGRPWFEEAAANSGGAVQFSWARRNRVVQGTEIFDHSLDDVEPEVDQITRLTFFFTTPSTAPGVPPTEHMLRAVDVADTSYAYSYAFAQADGEAAGAATGVCGTVVISVRIESLRGGIASLQSYVARLRLPSYPCVG